MSGQITNYDRLFNDLSLEIGNKYISIGIELGLRIQVLHEELETGVFTISPAYKKSEKMLHLWRNYCTTEDDFTYSVLSAALEKHGLRRCALKYCYTSSISSGIHMNYFFCIFPEGYNHFLSFGVINLSMYYHYR